MWMQTMWPGPLLNHKHVSKVGRNDDGPAGLIQTQNPDSCQVVYQLSYLVLAIEPVWLQHSFPPLLQKILHFEESISQWQIFSSGWIMLSVPGSGLSPKGIKHDGSKHDGPGRDCAPWISSQVLY